MKTTEEWDEEYERNIHSDPPGRQWQGPCASYRERIHQLETENFSLKGSLEEWVLDFNQVKQEHGQLMEALRQIAALDYRTAATTGAAYEAVRIARTAIAQGGQDE